MGDIIWNSEQLLLWNSIIELGDIEIFFFLNKKGRVIWEEKKLMESRHAREQLNQWILPKMGYRLNRFLSFSFIFNRTVAFSFSFPLFVSYLHAHHN